MTVKDIKPLVKLARQPLYSADQMQEHAKIKRDYIIVIDGGYGDQYKVTNHVTNGKKWFLQEALGQ